MQDLIKLLNISNYNAQRFIKRFLKISKTFLNLRKIILKVIIE